MIFGELLGATGHVEAVKHNLVNFKPTNLEGFKDILSIDKSCVVKYFEVGDFIRIIHGKYKGETGIVIDVNKHDAMKTKIKRQESDYHPLIKFDSSQRELRVNTNLLKLKTDHDQLT